MKKALLVLVVFVLVFAACTTKREPIAQFKLEPGVESNAWMVFDQYPVKMDAERALMLGLHEVVWKEPLRVYNCVDKKKNLWKEEVLPTGTKVLTGEDGIPIYKRSCWNKLFVPVTLKPIGMIVPQKHKHGKVVMAGWFWRTLLGAMIALAIIVALFCLFRWPWRATRQLFGKDKPMPPTTPVVNPQLMATPATPKTWSIEAFLDKNGKINIKGEGLQTLSTKCLNKNISIVASRR